jgi:hypothetical protein
LTPLILSTFGKYFGFLGTAAQFLLVSLFQVVTLLLYIIWKKPHHPETWTGLTGANWKLALEREKFLYFVQLCLGGVLAR